MSFEVIYKKFYEQHAHDEDVYKNARERIARKTFYKKRTLPMKIFTRVSFAVLGVLISFPLLAPRAFAEAVQSVGESISLAKAGVQIFVTRAFDKNRDSFSDEAIANLSEDPSIKSIEYTRDEEGEKLKLLQECDPTQECVFEVSGEGSGTVEGDGAASGVKEFIYTAESDSDNQDEVTITVTQ